MGHMVTVSGPAGIQEYELTADAADAHELISALFDRAMAGGAVELPVRVPGSQLPGRLVLQTRNLASLLVWDRPPARQG